MKEWKLVAPTTSHCLAFSPEPLLQHLQKLAAHFDGDGDGLVIMCCFLNYVFSGGEHCHSHGVEDHGHSHVHIGVEHSHSHSLKDLSVGLSVLGKLRNM